MPVYYSFRVTRLSLVSWNSRTKNKETPSSLWRGRFLAMKRASLHIEETPSLFVNNTIYSPLHSENGLGERLQSRDRRHRLSTRLHLHDIPVGNIPSFGGAWGGFHWWWLCGQTRASVPTNSLSLQIELITCLLVNQSTRQLEPIIILNYELWILN